MKVFPFECAPKCGEKALKVRLLITSKKLLEKFISIIRDLIHYYNHYYYHFFHILFYYMVTVVHAHTLIGCFIVMTGHY